MSSSRLSDPPFLKMHDVMSRHVEHGEVAGVVTLLSRDDNVQTDAIGVQDLNSGAPMQRDTIFRISSMTKPIVAVVAMLLVEEGTLRPDDPVDQWLPELADRRVLARRDGPLDDTVPANRPITVRDLLTLRMGFGFIMGPPEEYPILAAVDKLQLGMGPPKPATPHEPDEWLRRFATLPLMHQPG